MLQSRAAWRDYANFCQLPSPAILARELQRHQLKSRRVGASGDRVLNFDPLDAVFFEIDVAALARSLIRA